MRAKKSLRRFVKPPSLALTGSVLLCVTSCFPLGLGTDKAQDPQDDASLPDEPIALETPITYLWAGCANKTPYFCTLTQACVPNPAQCRPQLRRRFSPSSGIETSLHTPAVSRFSRFACFLTDGAQRAWASITGWTSHLR